MKKNLIFAFSFASLLCLGSVAMLSSCETSEGGSSLEESTKYHVTVSKSDEYTVSGIKEEGYEAGETVTFSIEISDDVNNIIEVKANDVTLTKTDTGEYSFKIGNQDVAIMLTLDMKTPIEKFLSSARKGFTFETTSKQVVMSKASDEELFTNKTKYEYVFDDSNGPKVSQKISVVGVSGSEVSLNVLKNDEGYIASEYINYKNEVDSAPLTDENGYYVRYDESFMNPFLLLEVSDFIKSEDEENTYYLKDDKLDLFEFFMESRGLPMKYIKFIFEGDSLIEIQSQSITKDAKALVDGVYQEAYYHYEDVATLKDLGSSKIESLKPSSASEVKDEVEEILSKVNDNFTLTTAITDGTNIIDETSNRVCYFDGSEYYVDYSIGDESKVDDTFYKEEDGKLIEYSFNETNGVFVKTANTSSTSYNIDPKDKSYFLPHLNEVSGDLFSKEGDTYVVNNVNADGYIGLGFLSDFEMVPYFMYGFGHDSSFTYDSENNSITIDLPFYLALEGYYYSIGYRLTYTNLGTTEIGEVETL